MAEKRLSNDEADAIMNIVRNGINLVKSLRSGPPMSKEELDRIKNRSMTAGLPKWKRRKNVTLAKKYLKQLMDESENYMLYYRDVAMLLETMLIEGVFKKLTEPEQRKIVSLYPENKKMVFYDIERVLRKHGEKQSQEIFWKMVAEYKPTIDPKDKDKPTTFLYAGNE